MLHEILLALVGHTGDIVVRKRDPRTRMVVGFHVPSDLDFLSFSEREAINGLVDLGYYYCVLEQFVDQNLRFGVAALAFKDKDQTESTDKGEPSEEHITVAGLYVRAMCVGLDEILHAYRACLLQVEQEILEDTSALFPLSKLRYLLREYITILPPLASLVSELQMRSTDAVTVIHGGQLLNYLHRRSLCGISAVQQCMRRLVHHVVSVLSNQLSSWVVHGVLTDPYDEFFIQKVTANPDLTAATNDDDANATTGMWGVLRFQDTEWNAQATLHHHVLPTNYISVSMANKILFIGQSVSILQHPSVAHHNLLLPQTQFEWSKSLHALRAKQGLDAIELNLALEKIRIDVSACMWQLLVNKADLLGHLKALKNYMLLGRGEFYQCFLGESQTMFAKPPGRNAARDLTNGPFQNAAAKLGLDENSYFKRLSFAHDSLTFDFPVFTSNSVVESSSSLGSGIVCVGSAFLVPSSGTFAGRRASSVAGTLNEGGVGPSAEKELTRGNGALAPPMFLQLTKCRASQMGAAWYSPRPVVADGFRTTFGIQAAPSVESALAISPEGRKEGFAFVIQNGGMTCLPSRSRYSESSRSPVFAPLPPASLVLEFILHYSNERSEPRQTVSCFLNSSVPRAAANSSSTSTTSSTTSRGSRCLGSATLKNLFDGTKHTLTIEYSSDILMVLISGREAPVLTVKVKGLELRRSLQLEGGRAWVGFITASGSGTKSIGTRIMNWKFEQREVESPASNGWRNLRLLYEVPAPLDLVLMRESFDRYNALFRFLFQIKRIQTELQEAWLLQMRLPPEVAVLSFRHNMQFFIDNLQLYLQVDVLEAQHMILLKKIQESEDFATVREAHQQYLSALVTQCFLKDKIIESALMDVFASCLSFCRLLRRKSEKQETIKGSEIAELKGHFQRQSSFLFAVISKQMQSRDHLHLSQLVLRVDYNRFFSEVAGNLSMH